MGLEWPVECKPRSCLFMHCSLVQNIAARMVTRRCDRITPFLVLENLHWPPVSQRVVFKTAFLHGLEVYPRCCSSLPQRPLHTCHGHVCSTELALCIQSNLTGSALCGLWWDSEVSPSTHRPRPTVCRLHTCTEDAPVLDRRAPLRRFTRFRRRILMHAPTYTYLSC